VVAIKAQDELGKNIKTRDSKRLVAMSLSLLRVLRGAKATETQNNITLTLRDIKRGVGIRVRTERSAPDAQGHWAYLKELRAY
jgi:hypothetical protein